MQRFLIALVAMMLMTSPAWAGSDLIVKSSPYGVIETLDRFEKILKSKGVTVFARIDHAAGAKKIGADMPATALIIFGNPKLGTPLMQSNRVIGIDLPLKVLAWKDGAGKVHLAYNDPAYLAKRHGIADRAKVFTKMTGVLDKLTNAAIKK